MVGTDWHRINDLYVKFYLDLSYKGISYKSYFVEGEILIILINTLLYD